MDSQLYRLVRERAQDTCEYCRISARFDPLPFQVDHIIAIKHLGPTVEHNLALSCFSCNNHKGPNIAGIDPDSGKITPLYHPRQHQWSQHFRWNGPLLLGVMSEGRATIAVLAINLQHRMEWRTQLIEEGVFPPVIS